MELRLSWSPTSRTVLTRQWSTTSDARKDDSLNSFKYFNRRIRRSTSCEPCVDSSRPKLNLSRKLWKVCISFHSEISTCVSDLSVVFIAHCNEASCCCTTRQHFISWLHLPSLFNCLVTTTLRCQTSCKNLWFDCSWLRMRMRHRLSFMRSWRWCSCYAELMKHYCNASVNV